MLETLEQTSQAEIKIAGNSLVTQLPEAFTAANNLPAKTQVLLTFKDDKVEAEILPPVPEKLAEVAHRILDKRAGVFAELQRIGD